MLTAPSFVERTLTADRALANAELARLLDCTSQTSSGFREAMRYAVLGGGQRFRPILTMRIARLTGNDGPLTLRAAAAVELLHCASLIVDDLPSMDDSPARRGRPSAHVAYGEAPATLAAFGLVALAARSVVDQNCAPTELSSLIDFQIQLLKVLDLSGLCEGQDLDLRLNGAERDAHRDRLNELKTVPLFDLAARAGLLFTDPGSNLAIGVRAFAREFGLAFQLVDDWLDGECEDFGPVERQLDRASAALQPFRPAAAELEEMVDFLLQKCELNG